MAKWSAVILGFILAMIVKVCFSSYELIGLIIIGFLVGYIAKEGIGGGLWNAALAGAFGTIVASIIFILIATTGGTLLGGIFGGLAGFTISGFTSLIEVVYEIMKYALIMGIAGAVGGAITKKTNTTN